MEFEIQNGVLKKYHEEEGITDVTIPDGVTSIGNSAFENCSNLTKIHIPDSVTSIGDVAFFCCSNLESITIPKSVTSIGWIAFEKCTNLKSINVDENNNIYTSQNGVLFNKNMTELLCCPKSKAGTYTIPDGVVSVMDWAFSDCSNLKSITIPDSITSIGNFAFKNCSSLTDVNIPDGVTSIEERTFYGCSSLTQITISASVTSIGEMAFDECQNLESINIPDSVMSIENSAFYNCSSLTQITIPDGVTFIGNGAFFNCKSLKSITIHNHKFNLPKLTVLCKNGTEIDKAVNILFTKDYDKYKVDCATKYYMAVQVFLQSSQPEAEKYVKENLEEVIKAFIRENDYNHLKEILDCDKFTLTYDKITSVLKYAIENTQNGGNVEIQAYIMEYKHKYFSENNLLDNLKLNF